jgi:hypothetical protein
MPLDQLRGKTLADIAATDNQQSGASKAAR